MALEKLDRKTEGRVLALIESAVKETRKGVSPDDALSKAASGSGLTPDLVRRACEAFNKSKTVYLLSKLSSDRRAESFALADPDKVISRTFSPAVPASPALPCGDYSSRGLSVREFEPLQKAASEEDTEQGLTHMQFAHRMRMLRNMEYQARNHRDSLLLKAASIENLLNKAAGHVRFNPTDLSKVASIMNFKYGEKGVQAVELLAHMAARNARAQEPAKLTLSKIAACVMPDYEPYASLAKAVETSLEIEGLKKKFAMTKTAAKGDSGDSGIPSIDLAAGTEKGLEGVKDFGLAVTSPTLYMASSMMDAPVSETLSAEGGSSGTLARKVLSPGMLRQLKSVDAKQLFTDVAADDFVKNYSLDEITDAYNSVVGGMPELQQPRYREHLKAMVRKRLAQGNMIDPSEIAEEAATRASLARIGGERSKGGWTALKDAGKLPGPVPPTYGEGDSQVLKNMLVGKMSHK